jgi:hypothetical protein
MFLFKLELLKVRIGIVLTTIIHHCKNGTTQLVGSKQLHDPRGLGNVIFKEENL